MARILSGTDSYLPGEKMNDKKKIKPKPSIVKKDAKPETQGMYKYGVAPEELKRHDHK